jgi:N-acetylneuraminic acid mutarotase
VYTTNNPGGLNLPNGYDIQTSGPFAITETTQLDLPLPLKEVTVEVRTPGGAGLAGVMLFTNAPTNPQTLAGKPASGYSFYNQNKVFTDENGRATLWLFPTAAGPNRYTITAVPPAGQPYATVTAQNVPVVGNDFKVIVLVSTDTTPPTITASATSNGSPYIGGAWTNAPVTVHFTCSDAQSGVASCPADQVFPAEGTFSASGTATDNGGNTAGTTFAPINIDLTPPVLTSLVSPGPSQPAGHFLDWATAAPMPTARGYAGTVTLNGFIYAIGGADPYPTTIGANERYDPATNTWTSLAPMPTPRAGTAVVAGADGKIYVIGGWTTGSDSLSTVEVYDLATNSWSSRPNAPVPANGMATATAANGDIYLFGGYPGCCFNYLANVYRYDPVNGTYTPRASMPIGRQGARAVPADNGKIYLFGGNGSPAVNGKEVTAYDPATNSWQAKSPMPLGVTYAAGFRATNGRIYILGARDGTGARVTMEYDVANDSWVLGDASPVSAVIQGSATTAAGEYFLLGGVDPLGANPLAGLPAVSRGTLAHIWTSGPVAVHWSCVDALSGVNAGLSDLADDVFNVSGTASATCLDNAGNSVTSTRSVTIAPPADTTPPELTAAATKEDGSAYVLGNWSNQVVTVRYTCIDSGSGVNASASDLSDDVELTSGTATATCVDNAGNQSVATVPVLVDHVTTTHYTATVVGQAPWNDTGINLPAHSQVSITASGIIVIAGSDGGHDPDGIPGCYEGFGASPGPGLTCLKLVARVGGGPVFEIGTSGAFSVAAGGRLYLTINDSFHGDNSGAWQAAVNVSLGAPEIYATATKADGQPYTAGMWTNGPVTVHFTCADGESGIATCPSDQTDTAAGLSYVSGTASDVAGNSASTTFGPIRIDTGVPSFTSVTYTRADGSTYVPGTWTNQAVTVTFACQDLVSGVANCPGSQTFAAEGSYAGTVLTTDNAGNQGSTAYGPVLIDNLGANTTIHVVDHNGLGLSGATASAWYSGAWHAIPGSSDAQGRLPAGALPKVASLQVAVTFNGTRLQLAYAQLTASDFTFQTQLVSMRLHDSSGQPLDVGAASYYAGSWRTAGNTISGTVTAEMLPGSYSFAMIYNGTRVQLTQDIGANPVVVFQTVGVTVRLSSSAGGALDGGAASYYAGSWRSIGDTVGGQVRVELLPGNYTFAMTYLGTRAQVAHDVGSNPVVTFTTGKVHSASDTATSYYAGSWRPFVQDMELLAGSYTFAFSGAPNKSQTLAGGVVNVID